MRIVGLKAALNSNNKYKYRAPAGVVDHLVVGGGVVGLAIARFLTKQFPDKSTYLVERNAHTGEETSSRNSEVIHAGLYYPADSLKERLCIRGRHLLYEYCKTSSIPFRKAGKLIVAHEHQRAYIESLHAKCSNLRWPEAPSVSKQEADNYPPQAPAIPTQLISGDEARRLEPDLSPDIAAALYSHETGIIDSHTLMESLERDIMESENGELVYSTAVVRVDPYNGSQAAAGLENTDKKDDGWVVQMVTGANVDGPVDSLLARAVINSSGLNGALIINSLLHHESRIPMYFARGSYAAYNGPGVANVKHLIYPCPDTDKAKGMHSFQALGTHLTLDLNGNVKFGPDIQWISPGAVSHPIPYPEPVASNQRREGDQCEFMYDEDGVDFWKKYLVPNELQLAAMHSAVQKYLPGVEAGRFRPDYVGIRPKLVPPWGGFQDFMFRTDHSSDFLHSGMGHSRGGGMMLSVMGIESPGLTASLAIAEHIGSMLNDSIVETTQ